MTSLSMGRKTQPNRTKPKCLIQFKTKNITDIRYDTLKLKKIATAEII